MIETVTALYRNNFSTARGIVFTGQPLAGDAIAPAVGLLSGAIFSKPRGNFGSVSPGNPWVHGPLAAIGKGLGLGLIGYAVGGMVAVIPHIFRTGRITADDSR